MLGALECVRLRSDGESLYGGGGDGCEFDDPGRGIDMRGTSIVGLLSGERCIVGLLATRVDTL